MKKEWSGCKKIAVYGNTKEIEEAEKLLDTLPLNTAMSGWRLDHEGEIRIQIQDAMETHPLKASILVDGNTVYPLSKTIREYERCMKTGSLERMSNYLYYFLSLNFDIAHYNKRGYIDYYDGSFWNMKKEILDHATTPGWHTDVQRILDVMLGRIGLEESKKKKTLEAAA